MTARQEILLRLPDASPAVEHEGFARLCTLLAEQEPDLHSDLSHADWIDAAQLGDLYAKPALGAAAHMVLDLLAQGWAIRMKGACPALSPPRAGENREAEKARVRAQEHVRRDEQLRRPSVRRFIQRMEAPRRHGDEFLSVFNLMRDGDELLRALDADPSGRTAIRPYVQVVDDSACAWTGFKLHDIWRYFRHTWSNAYATVPGRSMPLLIRDAATRHHAVVGLAAVSSPIVQIAERDRWMGWETEAFVEDLRVNPSLKAAEWVAKRISAQQDEVYVADLLADGVIQPRDLIAPTEQTVADLKADAERHRRRHHQSTAIRTVRGIARDDWVARAETDLFRGKRSALLAETLDIRLGLGRFLLPSPTVDGLRGALADKRARTQLGRLIRRARGERVGTVVADLTVCGAIAPYNALAGGKLVGCLAVSPRVVSAYRNKYERPSEIASAMAGRPIVREARLSIIATTSLYGSGSSQYNRLFWRADVVGGHPTDRMGFHELGRSQSFGTSHFSDESVEALVRLSALQDSAVRVNGLFGEGVSPRLRKVRLGLAALGWPANDLLKHGRERILYGVPLVRNLRDYSLGLDPTPDYLLDTSLRDSDVRISEWWLDRWALRRASQPRVRSAMQEHRLARPVTHGARVRLPIDVHDDGQLPLATDATSS